MITAETNPTESIDQLQAYLLVAHGLFAEPVKYTRLLDHVGKVSATIFARTASEFRDVNDPTKIRSFDLETSLFHTLLDGLVILENPRAPHLGTRLTADGETRCEEIWEQFEANAASYPGVADVLESAPTNR